MSDTVLTIIGSVVAVAALGVFIAAAVFAWKFATKLQGATTTRKAESAAAHGWHFESAREFGKVQNRWSGATDGLQWTAEHVSITDNSGDKRHWRHTFRWRTTLHGGPASPLVLVPARSKLNGIDSKTRELPGILRTLADAAIDRVAPAYFGTAAADVDLSAWTAVEGHPLPDMRVLTPEHPEGALSLCESLAPVIARHAAALATGGEPPVILIQHDALHLASRADVSAEDVERAVSLGIGLASAVSPSR